VASRKLRVALVQMDIALGEPDDNRAHGADLARIAAQGADLVVLPEMFTTGYCLERLKGGLADLDLHPTGDLLSALAKETGTHIAATFANGRGGRVFNTMTIHRPDGRLVSMYDKVHLVPMMDEEKWLAPGERLATCDMAGVRAGLAICYDLRFPELFRSLALAGAEIFVMPAEWPASRIAHWTKLAQARAIENQAFVVACNRVGSDESNSFPGMSLVADPMGEVVAQADGREQVLRAELDFSILEEFRAKVPVFKDRRPEVYRER
jgi:predicted amidohydrolase